MPPPPPKQQQAVSQPLPPSSIQNPDQQPAFTISSATVQHAEREAVPPKPPQQPAAIISSATVQHAEREAVPPKPPSSAVGVSGKRAWPDQLVSNDKDGVARKFIKRQMDKGAKLTADQQRAAERLGMVPETQQPATAAPRPQPPSALVEAGPLPPRALPVRLQGAGGGLLSRSEAPSAPPPAPPATAAPHPQDPAQQQPSALHLLPGSAKPHAPPEEQQEHARVDRWAHSGSLRHLEPERLEALTREPMPRCNVPPVTDPEDPPPRIVSPPGPFTTKQLIPDACTSRVVQHGHEVRRALLRARRGADGWKAARSIRPEALILEEHEALNECGWGYIWRKRPQEDLWDAVQPSCWPEHPPDTSIDAKGWLDLVAEYGLTDQQLTSWALHGFPGVNMPRRAVIGFPHVGALKHAEDFEKMNQRDIENGFVTHGHEFPEVWPCVCDPMNLVIQKGKPRATIDKTMNLSSSTHPEPVLAYNDYIDLELERARCGKLSLPTTSVFCRGAGILLSCGLRVKGGKFDLSTFFRIHGKQMSFIHQSGRILETLYGIDMRVNFGEKDAPEHCCRASNALAHFIRTELRRLSIEYPCKVPQVLEWLALRLGLAKEMGEEEDPDFRWMVLFFFIYYIDDAGLAVICDGPLFNTKGEPKIEIVTLNNGQIVKIHQERPELFFFAAMAIVQRSGHGTPEKKQDPMGFRFELLGIDVDFNVQKQLLNGEKRRAYKQVLVAARKGVKTLENGLVATPADAFDSIVHKLNFAAGVIATGRQHLFYMRKALYAPNRLEQSLIIIGVKADKEMEWWEWQLDKSEDHGVPLASRFDFPTNDAATIVRYSDASREQKQPTCSGFGAWAVVRDKFVYVDGRWTAWEVKSFSINVLEAKGANIGGVCIIGYAKSIGCEVTHTLSYVDNSTAENVAERGRATAESLHELNLRRQQWLIEQGLVESTDRVASIDNDVADLLSRGSVEEALRFPKEAGLPIIRLEIPEEIRDTSELKPTWN